MRLFLGAVRKSVSVDVINMNTSKNTVKELKHKIKELERTVLNQRKSLSDLQDKHIELLTKYKDALEQIKAYKSRSGLRKWYWKIKSLNL